MPLESVCQHQRREPRPQLARFRLPAEGVYHQRRRHNVTINSQEGNRENSGYVDARGTLRHSITPLPVPLHVSESSLVLIFTHYLHCLVPHWLNKSRLHNFDL